MNIFSVIGLIIATAVLVLGMKMASDNLSIFIDYPSMFIVIGGTFAATAICFQLNKITTLFKIFASHIIGNKRVSYRNTIAEIAKTNESFRNGEAADQITSKITDHFLKEAVQLLSEGVLSEERILKILEDRVENMNYMRSEDAGKIKTLGKFPPAFGMMGTTIGMIVLLANLGGEDAIKMIGPAMGVCLITTLYGVIIANLLFIPVAENLMESTKETHLKNLIVLEGVKHILQKSNPVLLTEELNSYLLPKDRLDWKELLKNG